MTDIPDEAVEAAHVAYITTDVDRGEDEMVTAITAALPILERAWIERLAGEENPYAPQGFKSVAEFAALTHLAEFENPMHHAWAEGFAAGYAKRSKKRAALSKYDKEREA